MNAILKALTQSLPGPLGTVLHIGAGAQAVDDHAGIEFQRLILVEADPDAHAELAADVQRSGRNISIRKDAVAAATGPLLWHRHSVRSLNGPYAADGLTGLYPRLRLLGTLPMPGTGIASLLTELAADLEGERPHVLVLDVPGQELALLQAIPDDLLLRFAWIAFRGSRATQVVGWTSPGQAAEALAQRDYAPVASTSEVSAMWPTHIHRFDRAGHAVKQLGKQLAALEQRCQQAEAALAAAKDEQSHERAELVRLTARLRDQDAELQHQQVELAALQARSAEAAVEHDALVSQLRQAIDEAQAQQRAQADAVGAATLEAAAQIQVLRQDRQRQDEQVTALQRERDEAARQAKALAAERDAAVKEARETAEQLANRQESLAAAQAALGAAKADQKRAEQAHQQRVAELEDEITQLQLRQRLLDDEVIKAEGQIELIKDVLLREPNL